MSNNDKLNHKTMVLCMELETHGTKELRNHRTIKLENGEL